jgi:hypothetical protein
MSATELESLRTRPLPEGELLRLNDWEETGAWVLAGAILLMGGLVALPVDGRAFGESIAGLILVGVGVMVAGVAGSGVVVGQDGITVRRLLRSRYLTWSEIDHFEVKTPLLRGALRIYLTDGTMISTPGLDGRSTRERHLSKAWISELNRRAAASSRLEQTAE